MIIKIPQSFIGADLDYESLPEIIVSVVASDSVPPPATQSSSVRNMHGI